MEETKEQIINLIGNADFGKVEELILTLNESDFQEIMQNLSDYQIRDTFLMCSDNIRKRMISSITNNGLKETLLFELSYKNITEAYQFIRKNKDLISDENFRKAFNNILRISIGNSDFLKKVLFEDKQDSFNINYIEVHQAVGMNFVKENITDFIKLEVPNGSTEHILDIIKTMEDYIGNNIYRKIDFRILDDQYINTIGNDGIINIALNNEKQIELLGLDETRLKILSECLKNNPVRNELDTYKTLLETILSNLSNNSFSDLINSIDNINNLTDADIKIFQQILQKDNIFEIKSLDDLRNYEELKKKKCDEWIKSEDIATKRLAVFQKIFGQDIDFLYKLQTRFSNIDEIKNNDIIKYVKCIREILQIDNPKLLEKIYSTCSQNIEINDIQIEQEIQKEYGNLFNDGLLKIEQCEKIDENVYEAGTEFKMIVHRRRGTPGNYFENWNQENSANYRNDYFCASYIRNDMIATFGGDNTVLYGFNELDSNTICGCTAGDGGTVVAMQSLTSPNDLINSVKIKGKGKDENCYNEINYKYFSNSQRQQPNYIIVFRINGEINNSSLNEAKKVQKQWNNKLPIVVVDVNKCIEAERQKVEEMKREYEQTKSPILAREIYHKIRNNQATIAHHKGQIQTNFFEEELQQYIVSDEEIEKYMEEHKEEQADISPTTDKPKSKIETIYDEINTIISEKDTIEQDAAKDIQEDTEQIIQNESQIVETEQVDIEITPKDIAKLDQDMELTTTEVTKNPLKRIMDKVREIKEKFVQGKNKDGR